ncbi:DNA mismatch repair protein MutL, partial [Thermodesulfobacteriota bacterium]
LIEPFGKNSYSVKEVPEILLGYNYKEVIHDIISDLMLLNKSKDIAEKLDGLIKLLACKGAVKANKRLTNAEIYKLLQDMSSADFPTNCPHGRPVVIELTQKDIRKMFKRI